MSSNVKSAANNFYEQKNLTLVPEIKTVKETYTTKTNVFITDFQEYMIKTARTNETGSPFKWWYNLNRLFRLLDYMISYMEYLSDFVKEFPNQISDLNTQITNTADNLATRISIIEKALDTNKTTQLTVSELTNAEITSGGIVVKGKEKA